MHIAVISDLHLGVGDRSDLFGHDDADFVRFLDFLERNFERIVLLGDVWETLAGFHPSRPRATLDEARRAHPEIARRFGRLCYSYVHGNHDVIAGACDGVPEKLELEADGVRLLFTHGHQNDTLWRNAACISEIGVWLGGWLRRVRLEAVYRVFEKLDYLRDGASVEPERCDFQRWAVGVAEAERADVIVTGHTHVATRAEHGDRLFLNSGSCSEGGYSFLAIDTQRGNYGVHTSW
jgi:predicted phosphodiesterase